MFINEFEENTAIYEQLLVVSALKGTNNNGSPYLSVTLQDRSGTIDGKIWDANSNDYEIFKEGNIVRVNANVISYKEKLQLKIMSGEKLDVNSISLEKFAIAAPVPQEELIKRLNAVIETIKDPDCLLIVKTIINEHYKDFITYPAAAKIHHDYMCGLLYHTVSMAELALEIASHYPEVNQDILVSGALIHDIGKTIEFTSPILTKYSLEGKLLGHISIMNVILTETCEKLKIKGEVPVLLEHMVLSHHGKLEYGSPVLPLTREALLLSMIDEMDSKMNVLYKALSVTEPGEFSQRIFALDDRTFYNPKNNK